MVTGHFWSNMKDIRAIEFQTDLDEVIVEMCEEPLDDRPSYAQICGRLTSAATRVTLLMPVALDPLGRVIQKHLKSTTRDAIVGILHFKAYQIMEERNK